MTDLQLLSKALSDVGVIFNVETLPYGLIGCEQDLVVINLGGQTLLEFDQDGAFKGVGEPPVVISTRRNQGLPWIPNWRIRFHHVEYADSVELEVLAVNGGLCEGVVVFTSEEDWRANRPDTRFSYSVDSGWKAIVPLPEKFHAEKING